MAFIGDHCKYCQRFVMHAPGADYHRTRDHVIPLSKGGRNDTQNIVVACLRCNNVKADMMPTEWRQFMSHDDWRRWHPWRVAKWRKMYADASLHDAGVVK